MRQIFSFQNSANNQDPPYKTDLGHLDCLGRVKTRIIAKFHTTDLVICSRSTEGENPVL